MYKQAWKGHPGGCLFSCYKHAKMLDDTGKIAVDMVQ